MGFFKTISNMQCIFFLGCDIYIDIGSTMYLDVHSLLTMYIQAMTNYNVPVHVYK
jgi:hypothetical protein